MQQRIIRRYSLAFQRQVVEDLERGRFASIEEARRHHEIPGKTTVSQWLRRHGKNHLLAKVVRVEKPDEADRALSLPEPSQQCRLGPRGAVSARRRASIQTPVPGIIFIAPIRTVPHGSFVY